MIPVSWRQLGHELWIKSLEVVTCSVVLDVKQEVFNITNYHAINFEMSLQNR